MLASSSSATPTFTSAFEQRFANLRQRRVQVLIRELALPAQILERSLQLPLSDFQTWCVQILPEFPQ